MVGSLSVKSKMKFWFSTWTMWFAWQSSKKATQSPVGIRSEAGLAAYSGSGSFVGIPSGVRSVEIRAIIRHVGLHDDDQVDVETFHDLRHLIGWP
jgi:hypothetical protein